MVMAAEVEAVTVSLGFIAGYSGRHDTHASGARRDVPKQPSGGAGAGRDRKHAKPGRSQAKFPGSFTTVQEENEWARGKGLPEQEDNNGIKYCVPGPEGWRFPDFAWKQAHYDQAQSAIPRRCHLCHNLQEELQGKNPAGWHFRAACPSPLVSHRPVHARHVHVGHAVVQQQVPDGCAQRAQREPEAGQSISQHVAARQGVPMAMAVPLMREDGRAEGQPLCAHVSALPHSSGSMMLLHGCAEPWQRQPAAAAHAAGQEPGPRPRPGLGAVPPLPEGPHARRILKVLLDSGSSHCVLNKRHARLAQATGKMFSTSVADGASVSHVPQARCSFSVQGQQFDDVGVLLMDTCDDFDVIFGLDWMRQYHVELKPADDVCVGWNAQTRTNFFFDVPGELKHSAHNVRLNFCSAGAVAKAANSKHDHVFAVHLQPVVDAHINAAHAEPVSADQLVCSAGLSEQVHCIVEEYRDVFPAELPAGLPPDRPVAHAIPLKPGAEPPAQKLYRLSWKERQELENQLGELLAKGWIQPSTSPYGSPILFVHKKDGGSRMCVDYRAVNKQTVRNNTPSPRIDDTLDQLEGPACFSCLDLQQAYQVELNKEDVPKTAFTTPMGLFEYKVLSFGLTNAPATFQSLMQEVLGEYVGRFCVVYLDDILVFSKSPENAEHLRLVLAKLRKHKLYAKRSKCKFAMRQVQFLGHVVDAAGETPGPAQLRVIQDWPVPLNSKQLRQFLGLGPIFQEIYAGVHKPGCQLDWAAQEECKVALEIHT